MRTVANTASGFGEFGGMSEGGLTPAIETWSGSTTPSCSGEGEGVGRMLRGSPFMVAALLCRLVLMPGDLSEYSRILLCSRGNVHVK